MSENDEEGRRTVSRRGIVATSAVIGAGAITTAASNAQTAQAAPKAHAAPHGSILVNNVGYESHGSKRALVAGTSGKRFDLIDADTGKSVHHGSLSAAGAVKDWGNTRYLVADFTGFHKTGQYMVKVEQQTSTPFRIEDDLLERRTASDVIHYFKGSRCTGQFDKRDAAIPTKDHPHARHDVRGGWYDATGDFGKHPWLHRTAWMLFTCYDQLTTRHNANFTQLRTWLLDEAMFGADYLVRIHPKKGTFYEGVSQPGPPKDPKRRILDTDQVKYGDNSGYGGGLDAGYAIAALALASTYDVTGEYNTGDYIRCAEEAWTALEDEKLAGDIRTLTDALTAATELFRATGKQPYRKKAAEVTEQLVDRLGSWKKYKNYWTEDDDGTPYQDGTDGGHPVVALLSYHDIAPHADRAGILKAVRKSLDHELAITSDVNNPFGYARQLVEDDNGKRRAGFFLPHDIHGRSHDMWWQGENARLGSLATAARCAAPYFDSDPHFARKLRAYANDQLNWILGVNPYAACMLAGSGLNTPQYDWQGSWQFLPFAGGICNGITGRHDDGSGIAWNRGYAVTGKDDDWRWQEQWLPHASWFLYAVCIGEHGKAIKPLAEKGVRRHRK